MRTNALISIVSHGQQAMIVESDLLQKLSGFRIILRENLTEARRLVKPRQGLLYVHNLHSNGFGANHNRTFEMASLSERDWFIICNPDILADAATVDQLLSVAEDDSASLAAPDLVNGNESDENIRPFPTIASLLLSLAGKPAKSRYNKAAKNQVVHPDWASGAFLAIRAGQFRQLGGFDERFFMYMEDVDLCRRARNAGYKLHYYPQISITHNAGRRSRRITSPYFRYHIASAVKYFFGSSSCA